jgi:putative spermidine/putrescine transport system substrate-binding protein
MLDRRLLLQSALTLGAMHAFPGLSYAQARPLVFAVFPGNWEEAARDAYVPAFRSATKNAQILLDPMLSFDSIAKINASKANPPIDVMLHDPGPALTAIDQGLVETFPVARSAHYKDLIADAQDTNGPTAFFQAVGLAYNPDTVKKPPVSWEDLWRPEFKGRVGITNLASTIGVGFMVEIARMNGGSEKDIDPGFKAIDRLKPNLSAVAASPAALHALFQQGQIDIAPANFNAIQILKARGVPVEFVVPKEGVIGFKTSIHLVKNTPNLDLALQLIDAALSPDVQSKLVRAPYLVIPTNSKVKIDGEVARVLAKDADEIKKKFVFQDWPTINKNRAAWIERFSREIRL